MQREKRYTVIKDKDIAAYLTEKEKEQLDDICRKINRHRLMEGRALLECVVVEHDWPEYERTWDAIELRVRQEKCEHKWTAVAVGDPTWCMQCGASGPIAD